MKKTKDNCEHYYWGELCEGWRFLDNKELNVTREIIPFGKGEKMHLHNKAQQFFYIISGTATFEIEGKPFTINADEGIEVLPGKKHSISNECEIPLEFIVISQPTTRGDRKEL
jgi:mannose-6-phosphate isomerase-like protein (cupin superfamily)